MKPNKEPNISVEYPNGRTLGECLHAEVLSIKMIDGQFVSTLHIKDKPKRLSREEALIYYTRKLRALYNLDPSSEPKQ